MYYVQKNKTVNKNNELLADKNIFLYFNKIMCKLPHC